VSRSTASYKREHHPVQSFPSHVITTPNGPARLQGESGVAARLVPVTVDRLVLAAPRGPDLGRRCPDGVRSWPLRELAVGELDDQRDDAQQDDPNESTSAFEREVDAKSGTREVACGDNTSTPLMIKVRHDADDAVEDGPVRRCLVRERVSECRRQLANLRARSRWRSLPADFDQRRRIRVSVAPPLCVSADSVQG
jgi:hypothetical protein